MLTLLAAVPVMASDASGSAAGEPPAAGLGFVSLLDCTAAGDYRWLELDRGGTMQLLRAGSSLRLIQSRRGIVPAGSSEPLFAMIEATGFFGLDSSYPFRSQPDEEVEHRYYALTAGDGRVRTTVAHEIAAPEGLRRLITSLQSLGGGVLPAQPSVSYLVAVPAAMLVCLGEDARSVDPGATDRRVAGYLRQAARSRGRSVEVPPAALPDLKELVFAAANVVRLPGDEDLALVLLESPQ